jgi:hypothetical protein
LKDFSLGYFVRFCGGVWEKWAVGGGFLMVKLWWIDGESWRVGWSFLSAKNLPPF